MKAFVTGATGFLGTHLVRELDHAGWEMVILHRKNSDLSELKKIKNISYALGDVTDLESLNRGIPENVDAVFHVAGSVGHLPHHQENSRYVVNQQGSANVVAACLKKNVGRLIYTTTVLTYDFHAQKPVTEQNPPNDWSTDAYIRSKRLSDLEIEKGLSAGLDVVFLHPSAIFGSYDKATWSKMFLEIQRGLPLPFAPPGGGSACFVKDVAKAHLSAFEHGRKGEHYILGGPDVTWLDVAREIARLLGKPAPIMRIAAPLFKAYGYSEYYISTFFGRNPTLTPHAAEILCDSIYSSSEKARRELGYSSTPMEEMLEDCYRWMVDAGMLPERKTTS